MQKRSNKSITVLSTACGAMFMPGFFECLKENGERNIRIIGVDLVASVATDDYLDAYYSVPRYSEDSYVDELINICKKEKVDIFFPQISNELPIILESIDRFKNIGVKVAITDNSTLYTANNKLELYKFMDSQGLATPEYYSVSSESELKEAAKKLGYPQNPFCLKISDGSGSRGVRIITENGSKLDAFLHQKPSSFNIKLEEMCEILSEAESFPELIAMEYLPGCEYTVDLLADKGETLYIAGRLNYESSMSIAMASVIEKRQEAFDLCTEIVKKLNLDGNIGFDFMLNKDGEPVLTDLNPRITATIVLYLKGGLNLPYMRIKQLLGEQLPEVDVKCGISMKRCYFDKFLEENHERC